MRHLHTEPGSELSIPGEDSIIVIPTTVVGGYGNIHENVFVKDGGILAPGHASLMEADCQNPNTQGRLTVHNLAMEQYSILRISINGSQNDVITVQDTLRLMGKISLAVLPESETVEPGSYLFLEYGDVDGLSKDYVKNFILLQQRYGNVFFTLDFSTPGKAYLIVSKIPTPEPQRYVDLPEVKGLTYNYVRVNGQKAVHNIGRNYVKGHQDFEVNLTWEPGFTPLKVHGHPYYAGGIVDLDVQAKQERDDPNSTTYILSQVVDDWTITFGPDPSSLPWYIVGNENVSEQKVWTYRNTLYINVPAEDVASIYNVTGVLNKKVEVAAGLNKLTLNKGLYIVTLKDGKVYKFVVQ
jgi:hypothetical protein